MYVYLYANKRIKNTSKPLPIPDQQEMVSYLYQTMIRLDLVESK